MNATLDLQDKCTDLIDLPQSVPIGSKMSGTCDDFCYAALVTLVVRWMFYSASYINNFF